MLQRGAISILRLHDGPNINIVPASEELVPECLVIGRWRLPLVLMSYGSTGRGWLRLQYV
jgi:hypothetical protein